MIARVIVVTLVKVEEAQAGGLPDVVVCDPTARGVDALI